jgi:hypothetical protein
VTAPTIAAKKPDSVAEGSGDAWTCASFPTATRSGPSSSAIAVRSTAATSERLIVHDWSLCEVVAPEWGGLEAFARGGQAPHDPSYRILGGVAGRTT